MLGDGLEPKGRGLRFMVEKMSVPRVQAGVL